AMDTGLVLQLRVALDLVDADVQRIDDALAGLAAAHRRTVMAGRTWLKHAEPTTFGLKAAGWLDGVRRGRRRLEAGRPHGLRVQLGGAAGTLAVIGPRALEVVSALAADLGVGVPAVPWHTQRDRLVELASILGLLAGTLGKIARDLVLLSQTEVAEV